MPNSKYVIVGNSAAAIGAIESLRQYDQLSPITVISDEDTTTAYARPLITYALAGKIDWSNLNYRPKEFYRHHKVDTLLGKRVVKIEPKKKRVLLENGKSIRYEKLLLATGGKPVMPPIKGIDKKGVFTFTTLSDAREVQAHLRFVNKAVVIGGGLIGLKTAESLSILGVETTVVELLDRLLAPVLDEYASSLVKNVFEERGVTILTGVSAQEILPKNKRADTAGGVRLSTGKILEADLVVVAVGVRPSKELAEEAGLKTNRGILVNERMETSEKDIYAAGDVTEGYDLILKTSRPLPIWPNAYLQGSTAGASMAGINKPFPGGLSMNSTTFFGYPIASAGLANPENESEFEVLRHKEAKHRLYRKLVIKEKRLVGFITTGAVSSNGLLVSLIKNKTKVSGFKKKLLKEDLKLIDLPSKIRSKKLNLEEENERLKQSI
jgi:NAD(P)H-nitrite reductase large subunit